MVLNKSEEGFSVSCLVYLVVGRKRAPRKEALENIQDAITEYLAAVDQLVQGQEVREVSVAS